jgi:soluble lytic murein transglycosylase-like protein
MTMTQEQLYAVARSAALNAGLDPVLVQAVIEHESSWNPWAARYEPGFYNTYTSHMKVTDTEKTLRATSFGLMQVMGQVAREKGFDDKFLTALLDPLNSVTYGCRKLKDCLDRENGDIRGALLRYNGGGDPHYPDMVLPLMDHYKGIA